MEKSMHSASRVMSRSSIASWSVVAVSVGMVSSFNQGVRMPDDMSCLQIAVHEVDLLEPAKTLADVLRTDFSDALHRLQLGVGRRQDLVEPAEFADDVLHHELGQPGYPPQDPVAAR